MCFLWNTTSEWISECLDCIRDRISRLPKRERWSGFKTNTLTMSKIKQGTEPRTSLFCFLCYRQIPVLRSLNLTAVSKQANRPKQISIHTQRASWTLAPNDYCSLLELPLAGEGALSDGDWPLWLFYLMLLFGTKFLWGWDMLDLVITKAPNGKWAAFQMLLDSNSHQPKPTITSFRLLWNLRKQDLLLLSWYLLLTFQLFGRRGRNWWGNV